MIKRIIKIRLSNLIYLLIEIKLIIVSVLPAVRVATMERGGGATCNHLAKSTSGGGGGFTQ